MSTVTATGHAGPTAPSRLKRLGSNAFGTLQKIGKALMLPVAVLPVAGILLGALWWRSASVPEALAPVPDDPVADDPQPARSSANRKRAIMDALIAG